MFFITSMSHTDLLLFFKQLDYTDVSLEARKTHEVLHTDEQTFFAPKEGIDHEVELALEMVSPIGFEGLERWTWGEAGEEVSSHAPRKLN